MICTLYSFLELCYPNTKIKSPFEISDDGTVWDAIGSFGGSKNY